MSLGNTMNKQRRSARAGFTLLEILVVLGISALISSLVLGAFATMQANSRRSNCQSNMAQIYRALRLYVEDVSAPPPHLDTTRIDDGLWLLWGFRDPKTAGKIVPPRSAAIEIQGYLRTESALHCPNDTRADGIFDATGAVNPLYLSYQVADPDITSATASDVQTYFPRRTLDVSDTANYLRQLIHQRTLPGSGSTATPYEVQAPTPATTIVTWCPYHRNLGSGRADNVLFYDGTVKRMPTNQTCGTTQLQGWRRVPDCSTG